MSLQTLSPVAGRCAWSVLSIVHAATWANLDEQRQAVHALADAVTEDGLPNTGHRLHEVAANPNLDLDAFRIAIGEIALDLVDDV